jgi:hypothetical protein
LVARGGGVAFSLAAACLLGVAAGGLGGGFGFAAVAGVSLAAGFGEAV